MILNYQQKYIDTYYKIKQTGLAQKTQRKADIPQNHTLRYLGVTGPMPGNS